MLALFTLYMIVCSVFVWVGSQFIRADQELFYQLSCTVVLLSMFLFTNTKPIIKNKISLWLGIFCAYTVFLFTLNGAARGANVMFNTFLAVMVYFATLQLKKDNTKFILKVMLWIAVANMLFVSLQMAHLDPLYVIKGPQGTIMKDVCDPIGFFGNKAIMGMYMGLATVAGLLITPLSLAFLPLVYISKATGDILGTISGVLFVLYWTKRKLFWIFIPALALAGIAYVVFVDMPLGMMGTRPPMWKEATRDTLYGLNLRNPIIQSPLLRNPITGFGLDMFRIGNIKYFLTPDNGKVERGFVTPENTLVDYKNVAFTYKEGKWFTPEGLKVDLWDNPHNAFVECFYNYGLIGLTIVGFIFYSIWERFKKSIKTNENIVILAVMVTFMVFTVSQFPFGLARIAHLVPILLGLFVLNTEDNASNA